MLETIRDLLSPAHRRARRTRYKYRWLGPHDIRTVLDIGANTGQFASRMRTVLPEARIYSFEPLADCYAKLQERFAGDDRFTGYNCALGEAEGSAVIHRSAHSPSSSLLPMAELHRTQYPHTAETRDETITVRTLDGLAGELSLEPNVLIKVDVQGFEDRVIRGGQATFAQARVLLMEISFQELYEGQSLFDGVYDLLGPMGFAFHGFHRQAQRPLDGAVLFADAIFLARGSRA